MATHRILYSLQNVLVVRGLAHSMQLCALANPQQMTCNLCVTDLRAHASRQAGTSLRPLFVFIGVDARHFDRDVSVELLTHLQ